MEQSMSALLPSKEIYEALGEMCVRFQDVETALKWFGVSLRGADNAEKAHAKYYMSGFSALIQDVRRRANQSQPLGKWRRVVQAAEVAGRRRNELVHSTWSRYGSGGAAFRRKRLRDGSKMIVDTEVVSVETIRRFNKRLEFVFVRLIALIDDPTLDVILGEAT